MIHRDRVAITTSGSIEESCTVSWVFGHRKVSNVFAMIHPSQACNAGISNALNGFEEFRRRTSLNCTRGASGFSIAHDNPIIIIKPLPSRLCFGHGPASYRHLLGTPLAGSDLNTVNGVSRQRNARFIQSVLAAWLRCVAHSLALWNL